MNIAIAGAGIAGLTLSLALHQRGIKSVIFDQLESPAPIGSGLIVQPTGQAVLTALGLGGPLFTKGAPLERLYGLSSEKPVLDVYWTTLSKTTKGLGMHRAVLFDILFQAALDAGIQIETKQVVTGLEKTAGGGASLMFESGKMSSRFDLVVDAMGVRSPLAKHGDTFLDFGALWANVPWTVCSAFDEKTLDQRYHRADKMAGFLPIGKGPTGERQAAFFWSLKAQGYDVWRSTDLDAWKDDVLSLWPQTESLLQTITSKDDIVFARYAHHASASPLENSLIRIGDAWHAASPQLGQGANMAMLDAYALAKAIDEGPDIDAAAKAFFVMRKTHVRLYQAISFLFTPLYQSSHWAPPMIRDALAPFAKIPPTPKLLAAMVSGTLGWPLKKLGLS